MLLIHIVVALTSIFFAGYSSFSPSVAKLRITYVFVFATIGTGTDLILTTPSHMIATCIEGLVYIVFVTVALIYATRKLQVVKKI